MKILCAFLMLLSLFECKIHDNEQKSSSGLSKVEVPKLNTVNGMSVEQWNIRERIIRDNQPNSIKWIYCFGYTGQPVFRSTVRGKVTSGGKRLEPSTVESRFYKDDSTNVHDNGAVVNIGDTSYNTSEVIQADGTFGSSNPYVYWFDEMGNYFQWSGPYLVSSVPVKLETPIMNLRDVDQDELAYAKQMEARLVQDKSIPTGEQK